MERGVVFLMCQADREGVVAALNEMGAEALDSAGLADMISSAGNSGVRADEFAASS